MQYDVLDEQESPTFSQFISSVFKALFNYEYLIYKYLELDSEFMTFGVQHEEC